MQVASIQAGCLSPPRKLKDIGKRLESLLRKSASLRLVDNVQDNDDVSGFLEDLQEAVRDYMVRS